LRESLDSRMKMLARNGARRGRGRRIDAERFRRFFSALEVNAHSTRYLQKPSSNAGRLPQVRYLADGFQKDRLHDVFGIMMVSKVGQTDCKHGLCVSAEQRIKRRCIAIFRCWIGLGLV
jgi:hypothetical protein